jgi:hypothetical protein
MKKIMFLLVFIISYAVFSQNRTIEITNIRTGKVKVFVENQRIKIRTLDGKKHIGNLKISDTLSFTVNNQLVKIDSVQSIKYQPKTLATIKTVVLIVGLAIVGTSLVAASGGNDAAFLLFTVGSGVAISAGLLEGINANNSNNKWSFKIIEK